MSQIAYSSQGGPFLTTHNFPTDRSFHMGYSYNALGTSANYDLDGTELSLSPSGKIDRTRHRFSLEYQANRSLNFGAFLHYDQLKLHSNSGGSAEGGSFSEQVLFLEYRFIDELGYSLGLSSLLKFSAYANPTQSGSSPIVLFGDAQTDLSFLLSGEYWLAQPLRLNADFGYTYRSDEHSAELPYQLKIALTYPRFSIALAALGNLSFENDTFISSGSSAASQAALIHNQFSRSNYAFAENPSLFNVSFGGEFWLNSVWALNAGWTQSLAGKNAPSFAELSVGFTYRKLFKNRGIIKRYREIDIDAEHDEGVFDGELQDE